MAATGGYGRSDVNHEPGRPDRELSTFCRVRREQVLARRIGYLENVYSGRKSSGAHRRAEARPTVEVDIGLAGILVHVYFGIVSVGGEYRSRDRIGKRNRFP